MNNFNAFKGLFKRLLSVLAFFLVISSSLTAISTIEELDDGAIMSFSIMGDDHNYNPYWTPPEGDRMYRWMERYSDFVIGVGDHIASGLDASDPKRLPYVLETHPYYSQFFYPNIGLYDEIRANMRVSYLFQIQQPSKQFSDKLFDQLH